MNAAIALAAIVLADGAALPAWSSAAGNPDWWSVSHGVTGIEISSDAASLSCGQGVCTVWEKTQYDAPKPNGVVLEKDRVAYDCRRSATRTEEEFAYDAAGRAVSHVKAGPGGWEAIGPHTVGADTLAFACGFHRLTRSDLASGVVPAGDAFATRAAGQAQPSAATRATAIRAAAPGDSASRPAASGPAVQVAAAATLEAAQRAATDLEQASPALPQGLHPRVEPGIAGSARVYRVLVVGFASRLAAIRYCAHPVAPVRACFVRPQTREH